MRLLLLALLAFFAPAGVTLDTALMDGDLSFTIHTDAPRHFYVQLTPSDGAWTQDPTIYEFDLGAGESFGRVLPVFGPGHVAVQVWASDGLQDPVVESVVTLPAHMYYLPLVNRA